MELVDLFSKNSETVPSRKNTNVEEKSNKCNQCDYASSQASNLRTHLKTHSGEKRNKCSQCDFAFTLAGDFRRHLKNAQWSKVVSRVFQKRYTLATSLKTILSSWQSKQMPKCEIFSIFMICHVLTSKDKDSELIWFWCESASFGIGVIYLISIQDNIIG